jgi:hypothetical protein
MIDWGQPAPLVVERMGRALLGVPVGPLRVSCLEHQVRDAPPLPLARALSCAKKEGARGVLHARVVVETFGLLAHADRLPGGLRGALVTAAVMIGEDTLVSLVEGDARNDSSERRRHGRARAGSLAEQGETLGRRKTLARTVTGDLFVRVLDDPHPEVIRNALLNPHATEAHAVRVAARRPVSAGILEVVAHSRFHVRPAVRRALALNPDCPTPLACRIVATMLPLDLKAVIDATGVPAATKQAARGLLRTRARR